MSDIIEINGYRIGRGEQQAIELNIARLPTHTNIDLPIHLYRAEEDGPVLLLTGGLHGDEINGIEILRRMIHNQMLMPRKGTVIAMPLVNTYGFIQNIRGLPDGKDINRSFPGSQTGSLASLMAHTLMNQILPHVDLGIDFHTGGEARANYPQIRCDWSLKRNRDIAKAFSPPVIVNSSVLDNTFRKAAQDNGTPVLVYEGGEALRFDELAIQEGIDGTLRLMEYLEMIPATTDPQQTEIYEASPWIRAEYGGLFRHEAELGDHVEEGQLLGYISDPYGDLWAEVQSHKEGRIIGLNNAPVVYKGDALVHIACDFIKTV
ncbi:succinylglutamate desuccinylase/aspartoacylase family protein [Fodinibius sediminis]|nr:succinylglutamate desuccinylase/aspartoacylase family protein [Fodinibius sediminis]